MQAYLFDDFRVEIDERATVPGHCWHGQYRDGIPVKLTSDLERFFYKLTLGYENPVVLDIGANDGVFSLIAAINQHIRCFAFEPAPSTYEILRRNVALNNLEDRVKTFQLALADKKGTAVLKVPSSGDEDGFACLGNPLRFNDWVEFEVPVSTVDDFVRDHGIENVDLIKIDTEGCELFVLKGAERVIRKYRPGIFCECQDINTAQFGYRANEIVKLLSSWGYCCVRGSPGDLYFYHPTESNCGKPKVIDLESSVVSSRPKVEVSLIDSAAHFESAKTTKKSLMKTAFVKQVLDVVGPWSSVRWESTTPLGLFDIWPGKATLWETTCLLKADWYIIPQQLDTEYTKDSVLRYPGRRQLLIDNTSNVVNVEAVPFEEYDIVISVDPILSVPKHSRTLFAYYVAEHWDQLYKQSLKKPVGNYDLFLAHMLDASQTVDYLPQSISFPYLRDSDTMRAVFGDKGKEESVWIDWRTLSVLGSGDIEDKIAETVATTVEERLGIPVRYKSDYLQIPYGISEPPRWGDAACYLREMARSKYCVSVGRDSGAGQGLCDAASLGCICIGEFNKPFHRIVCHPTCLCADMTEMLPRLRRIIESPELQKQVSVWQDEQLREYFVKKPLSLLKDASGIKAKTSLPSNKRGCRSVSISPKAGADSGQLNEAKSQQVTIFAMPKCFTGAFAAIQRNAVGSWMQLRPRPEIILLGDDDGVADFALRYGFKHIPSVQRNEFGTPLLDDLFLKAQAAASNEICVYVNSDIILMDDFAEALESVARRFDHFLMVGRRWDLDMSEEIDFYAEDWEQRLIERVRREGIYHAPTGIDYFAFKKGLWPAIPPLALGRGMWDNWLVREPLLAGQPVVDASDKVTIIHQNHGHSHISGGKEGASFNIELQRNLDLTGNDTSLAYTSHAAWELTPNGIALRPISEFLKENKFSAALKCIESAYQQAPDIVKEQFEALRLQVDPDCLSRLLPVARRELILGSAKNVAKLLLNSLETENRSAAEEFFRKGFQYLNDGNVSEAVKHLERAAMKCTTLPNLYYALAAAYAQLGDIFSAKRACQVELSLKPDNRGAAGLLERIDQAADEYRQSLIG